MHIQYSTLHELQICINNKFVNSNVLAFEASMGDMHSTAVQEAEESNETRAFSYLHCSFPQQRVIGMKFKEVTSNFGWKDGILGFPLHRTSKLEVKCFSNQCRITEYGKKKILVSIDYLAISLI